MAKKILTRRAFLEASAIAVSALAVDLPPASGEEPRIVAANGFSPVALRGNVAFDDLAKAGLSETLIKAIPKAPRGSCVSWGIPFKVDRPILLTDNPVTEQTPKLKAEWIVFQHTTDVKPIEQDNRGFIRPMRGRGRLGEHIADYVIVYADGVEVRQAIRRRHQIGMIQADWGENCFQAVAHLKPFPLRPVHEQPSILQDIPNAGGWGRAETRVSQPDRGSWINWLWAWENPHPEKEISALRFEPIAGSLILSGVSAGSASSQPLRWQTRQKAILRMPEGTDFNFDVDSMGLWKQIQLDMGQVISVEPRLLYPNSDWESTYNNKMPEKPGRELLVEYAAHPDARFHLWDETIIPVAALEAEHNSGSITQVAPATRRVRIRTVDKASGKIVPVKLHVHGESSEYLAPVDRHRQANNAWFEDYAPEFRPTLWYEKEPGKWAGDRNHRCTYIDGETVMDLPMGSVYLEISKGFEVKPIRRVFQIGPETEEIKVIIDKVLPWRERGWVTADTHVHFLSPSIAHLEGSAEGVNIVNLLASQWGELMTNVGDFDGKTTFGSKEAGGDGEWMVRVGTENRQHVLGHISLLGYGGRIIAPMCSGGPDEAALGDPVGVLLMEWAEQCRRQNGIVVLPHFPNPRCEQATCMIEGLVDGVEMTSWGQLYGGIDPYSLSDWYRFLNLGYFAAAVGGTDKMDAKTAVGTVRTYAKIPADREFTYESWKAAIRAGDTFVTYGPLMEFSVDGRKPGSKIDMKAGGGRVDVAWQAASITVPMSKVELVVNGEVRESRNINPDQDAGHWSVKIDRCSWVALMVRGHYKDKPEIIAAHSSPVMIQVDGSEFFSAADAVTILDQIEGALAYIDTVGTRAQDETYKRMKMKLTSAYRKLHNQLHQEGHYHEHSASSDHE
jgi:hypothetical protein